ncbi:MAG: DUF1385 domain-containing protein [Calditrichaeota bacterium]|nr:MAG: DUF1385 domain-containing protein [Calditrichota bacterium]
MEKKITVGGQAVMEGVMMRGPENVAIAVRKSDGSIVVKCRPYASIAKRFKIFGFPLLRGAVVLIESLLLGVQALTFSGDIASIDEKKLQIQPQNAKNLLDQVVMAVTLIVSVLIGIFIFFYLPLLLTGLFKLKSSLLFNLVDGGFRLLFFVVYIYLISLWTEIRRVFEYHGAEHKSVYAFEAQKALDVESARPFSTLHPRCGTSFLMIVMVVSILVFIAIGKPENLYDRLIRLAFVPLIGGISYEMIRLSERAGNHPVARLLIMPGLWLQKITTKPPDDSQLEVALVALRCALKMEPQVGNSIVEMVSDRP